MSSNTAETDSSPDQVNEMVPPENLEASTQEHICPDPVTSQCAMQVMEDSDDTEDFEDETGEFEDDKIEEDESEEKAQEAKSQVSPETICDVTAVQQVMVGTPKDDNQRSTGKPKRTLRGFIKCMAVTAFGMECAGFIFFLMLFPILVIVAEFQDSALKEAGTIACDEGQQSECIPVLSSRQTWDCWDSVRELCLEGQELAWDEKKEEFWSNISEIATRSYGLLSPSEQTSLPTGLDLIKCETQRDQRFGASCKKVRNRTNLLQIFAGVFLGTPVGLGLLQILFFFTWNLRLITAGFGGIVLQYLLGFIAHLHITELRHSSPLWWGSSAVVTALLILICWAFVGYMVFEEFADNENEEE